MSKSFKIILGVLVTFIALIIIIGVFAPTEEDEIIPTNVVTTQRAVKKDSPKPRQAAWYKVSQWQGKSIKDTETFNISSGEWRISWETRAGEFGDMNFQIFIHKSNGDLVTLAANVIGYDKDSTIMRGKGSYYLSINTAQPYSILVEERR